MNEIQFMKKWKGNHICCKMMEVVIIYYILNKVITSQCYIHNKKRNIKYQVHGAHLAVTNYSWSIIMVATQVGHNRISFYLISGPIFHLNLANRNPNFDRGIDIKLQLMHNMSLSTRACVGSQYIHYYKPTGYLQVTPCLLQTGPQPYFNPHVNIWTSKLGTRWQNEGTREDEKDKEIHGLNQTWWAKNSNSIISPADKCGACSLSPRPFYGTSGGPF